jgi:hypothetical protein
VTDKESMSMSSGAADLGLRTETGSARGSGMPAVRAYFASDSRRGPSRETASSRPSSVFGDGTKS